LPRETIDRRIIVFVLVFGGLFTALTARLFFLQIIQNQRLSQMALRQQERTIEVQPARGCIYDRQGRPLALNVESQSFFAVPAEITQPGVTASKLSRLVGIPPARLERRLRSGKGFVWIKRKVTDATAQAIRALELDGIHSLSESKRVYPEGTLASHVLGFVGLDNQGLAGIELQHDRAIRGQSGWLRVTQDAKGRRIVTRTRVYKQSQAGQDVYLTIDKVIQHVAERELERGIARARARAGSVIVMDPATGEILALANKPDFDPNRYGRFTASARRNRAIHDVFEPGATFKLVTAAAALEEHCHRENDVIDCESGRAVFSGLTVRDHEPRGRLSFRDVITYSSNIGAVKIGARLGADRMAHYLQEFGFGRPTGVELPGEAGGLIKPLHQWQRWNMVTIPFGQGLAVTPLQVAASYAAVANDGLLPKPWIVKALRNPDATLAYEGKPEMRQRVISANTARRMRGILAGVVDKGTGAEAGIPNYRVAGKTGTAQKPMAGGGYDPRYHVASFVGFFPAEQPEVLIAVMIDEPEGTQWGGQIAGPIFREIGREMAAYLGISPCEQAGDVAVAGSQPRPSLANPSAAALQGGPLRVNPAQAGKTGLDRSGNPAQLVRVPGVVGQGAEEAKNRLKAVGLNSVCMGKGVVVSEQIPPAGKPLNSDSRVVLYLGGAQVAPAGAAPAAPGPDAGAPRQVVMPDLAGLR